MGNQTFCSCIISEKKNIQSNINCQELYYEKKYNDKIKEMNVNINKKVSRKSAKITKEETNLSRNESLYHTSLIHKNEEKNLFMINEEKQMNSSFHNHNLSFVKIHRKMKSIL